NTGGIHGCRAALQNIKSMGEENAGQGGGLEYKEDRYGGIIIAADSLPDTVEEFKAVLAASMNDWRASGVRGVWLKLPIEVSAYVPEAVSLGFRYHHAEPAYAMLVAWLPETADTLPANASHQVGVGAFVLDSQRRVLAVRERHGPLGGTGIWKLPTGLVNAGEHLNDAVEREVLEETGVDTRFLSVLAVRHGHGFLHQKSDLFFVMAMRLNSPEGIELTPQASEIAEAAFIDLDEFLSQEYF
ncbi:unnamed protein product, partial [Chrysoparadoxa australica]